MRTVSLKARSAAVILAIFLVTGCLAMGAFLLAARGISESFGRRFAEKSALLGRSRILAPIQREVALARKLADSETIRAWCRDEQDPGRRAAALAELDSYRRSFAERSYFFVHDRSRHYYFNDASDGFRGHELRYVLDPSDPTMAWYGKTMATVDDFALHVDYSEQLGLLNVWINVVVKDGGRKVGLAGTGANLTQICQNVLQVPERGVLTLMVDPRGVLQAHPDAAFMDYNGHMKDETRRLTLFQLVDREGDRAVLRQRLDRLVRGGSPLESFRVTVQGRQRLAAAVYVPEIDWVTLVLVDTDQVLGMRAFAPILGFLGMALLVTLALVTWLLNRMVLKPLGRLSVSTQEVASGRHSIELPVERDDEIGQLTAAFNRMAAEVRDHTANLEAKVQARTQALSQANLQLTESNRKILDSLEYARLLQASLLPREETLKARLADHFVLYCPRDIVGGDFHAFVPDERGFLLAMADCTGHGVPGAFMTMSASALLEQLLAKWGPEDPARLLEEMNRAMRALLQQEGPKTGGPDLDNGLELALVRVIPGEGRLRFAGARLPLWTWTPGGGFQDHPGDIHSLGYRRSRPDATFRNLDLPLEPGMRCFLFTDGILDQPGGPRGFGFGRGLLRETLERLASQPLAAQGAALAEALDRYRGDRPQRDDITLMAFQAAPPAEPGQDKFFQE